VDSEIKVGTGVIRKATTVEAVVQVQQDQFLRVELDGLLTLSTAREQLKCLHRVVMEIKIPLLLRFLLF
jgi:hypothetical protein